MSVVTQARTVILPLLPMGSFIARNLEAGYSRISKTFKDEEMILPGFMEH